MLPHWLWSMQASVCVNMCARVRPHWPTETFHCWMCRTSKRSVVDRHCAYRRCRPRRKWHCWKCRNASIWITCRKCWKQRWKAARKFKWLSIRQSESTWPSLDRQAIGEIIRIELSIICKIVCRIVLINIMKSSFPRRLHRPISYICVPMVCQSKSLIISSSRMLLCIARILQINLSRGSPPRKNSSKLCSVPSPPGNRWSVTRFWL